MSRRDILPATQSAARFLRASGLRSSAGAIFKERAAAVELVEAADDAMASGCPCSGCERIRAALAHCRGAA